jgi:cytochrome P450
VAFGIDYHTMKQPKFRYVMEAIKAANVRLSVVLQASKLSLAHLDRRIFARSTAAGHRFVKFLRILLSKRLKDQSDPRDIFSFLQQCQDPSSGDRLSVMELSTETATFLVAGKSHTIPFINTLDLTSSYSCI